MYLGSKLMSKEAPRNDEANEPKIKSNDHLQGRSMEGNKDGGGGKSVWRRKEIGLATRDSAPLGQEGEDQPHQPAATLIDTTKVQRSTPVKHTAAAHEMEDNAAEDAPQHKDPRKVVITFPKELFANLRSKCDSKASLSLLGRIQGKHPGLQALTAWAHETLHPSLKLLTLQANNIFEVTFDKSEGRIHA